jgi:carbamoyl-phosphate synthase small subunit
MKLATLVLEDGSMIEGRAFGTATDVVFELVFNTSMTGYQEILTDPSYRVGGQGNGFSGFRSQFGRIHSRGDRGGSWSTDID